MGRALERRRLRQAHLFCSDLDGTLVGDDAATERFRAAWQATKAPPLLVYSSGRLIDDMRALLDKVPLPPPDFLIGGVGTMMFDVAAAAHVDAFAHSLSEGWDLSEVERVLTDVPGAIRQPAEFLHDRKSSWYLHDAEPAAIAAIGAELAASGLRAQIVYSSARDLDVIPAAAAKGAALDWLCRHVGVELTAAIVAGDTGNDATMFKLPGIRGILVGNALPELVEASAGAETFHAREAAADGVLEGLRHFGVIA